MIINNWTNLKARRKKERNKSQQRSTNGKQSVNACASCVFGRSRGCVPRMKSPA